MHKPTKTKKGRETDSASTSTKHTLPRREFLFTQGAASLASLALLASSKNASAAQAATPLGNFSEDNGGLTIEGSVAFKGPIPWADVRAYGAQGDGSADDTDAIQAAIDAAAAGVPNRPPGIVYFPAGFYMVRSLDLTSKHVTLKGNAERTTGIFGDGSGHVIKAVNFPVLITGIVIEDLQIGFVGFQNSDGYDGVYLENVGLFAINRCGFSHSRYGVHLSSNTRIGTITDSNFGSFNQEGLFLKEGSSQITIMGNYFDENSGLGIRVDSSLNTIVGNRFQDNSQYHIKIGPRGDSNVITGNTFVSGGPGDLRHPNPLFTQTVLEVSGSDNLISGNRVADKHGGNDIVFRQEGGHGNMFLNNSLPAGARVIASSPEATLLQPHAGNVGIGIIDPNAIEETLQVAGNVKAQGLITGDIVFQKAEDKLWRMYEEDSGLSVENLTTGEVARVLLETDRVALKQEILEAVLQRLNES